MAEGWKVGVAGDVRMAGEIVGATMWGPRGHGIAKLGPHGSPMKHYGL